MSHGIIPMPDALLNEKRANAETRLMGFSPSHGADTLYKWAGEVLGELVRRADQNPKLALAKLLDIPSEPRWLAAIQTRRTKARHRVIARFARESLLEQIWSFNWDCVQESAFENVGIKRNGEDVKLPWPTGFKVFITATECAHMGEEYSVKMIKPHGCAMALIEAEEAQNHGDLPRARQLAERFLITKEELDRLDPALCGSGVQQFIFATLCTKLAAHPFIIAGWSASEEYFLTYMADVVAPILGQNLAIDELSIIDVVFNHEGHQRIAGFYQKDEAAAFIRVQPPTFDTDTLLLWVQALYAIDCLRNSASAPDRAVLEALSHTLEQPPDHPPYVISWVDHFLPSWVRLCWKSGLVECWMRDNQHPVSPDDIDMERPDEHIPWNVPNIARPDLKSAAGLLATLERSGNGHQWDFEMFPGGFFLDNLLVLPLPAWGGLLNDLRGLKSLTDAIKQPGIGFIDQLAILPVPSASGAPIPTHTVTILKETVARGLGVSRFARSSAIEEFNPADL